eukprot:14011134-Heterocapsa_arctica.AAC.1
MDGDRPLDTRACAGVRHRRQLEGIRNGQLAGNDTRDQERGPLRARSTASMDALRALVAHGHP